MLAAIERKLLWLSSWTIHNANHLRPSRDGLKVGGHQASCASVATIMTALYFDVLRPDDRVAVKPHASPIYHADPVPARPAEPRSKLERLPRLRRRPVLPVAHQGHATTSTSRPGSVGLGAAMTALRLAGPGLRPLHEPDAARGQPHGPHDRASSATPSSTRATSSRRCSRAGSTTSATSGGSSTTTARASTASCPTGCSSRIEQFFAAVGWRVVTLKYGKLLQAAFAGPGGEALRDWIDDCPNDLYSALAFKGGAAWRAHLERDLGGIRGRSARMLDEHDDAALARPDDQPRRPRPRDHARGVPRRRRTTGRTASSPTRSRATACRSPATRTTTPG